MTSEEMERAIEFLLQSQANYETRLAQTDQRLDQTIQRLDQTIQRLDQTIQQVAETSKQLQAYAETQSEFIQIMTGAVTTLTEAQLRTDERLNNLITLVERSISEGRNGS